MSKELSWAEFSNEQDEMDETAAVRINQVSKSWMREREREKAGEGEKGERAEERKS